MVSIHSDTKHEGIVTHSFITCTLLRHITKPSGKSPPTIVVTVSYPIHSPQRFSGIKALIEGSGSIIIIIIIIIIITFGYHAQNLQNR